ncbi:MAG UNVERIFIED_CONTAM: hypothetical protein LVR29_06830 [Microcystis novacekii LVE1205-3]|jgi:hypothetical protein
MTKDMGLKNLTLTGFGNINATGNSENNILKGNSAEAMSSMVVWVPTLWMVVMDNDTYYVDNVGDIVKEIYDDS